jgi:hypothetical protein
MSKFVSIQVNPFGIDLTEQGQNVIHLSLVSTLVSANQISCTVLASSEVSYDTLGGSKPSEIAVKWLALTVSYIKAKFAIVHYDVWSFSRRHYTIFASGNSYTPIHLKKENTDLP